MISISEKRTGKGTIGTPAVRFVDHPHLHSSKVLRQLLDEAERLLRQRLPSEDRSNETVLFKARHACASLLDAPANERKTIGVGNRRLHGLQRRLVDHLVNANVGLVYNMMAIAGSPADDDTELTSTGLWTLYQAVLAFDPWRGFRFSTYACQAILRGFRHIARRDARRRNVLESFVEDAANGPDRSPTENTRIALLADRLRVVLDKNAAELTAPERFIIEHRFLRPGGERPLTLTAIGKLIELSRERVRQIQVNALEKLRRALTSDAVLCAADVEVQ